MKQIIKYIIIFILIIIVLPNLCTKKRKKENDDVYRKYRVIGTRKKTRVSRNPEIEIYKKDLKQYREIGKKMYKDARSGKISKKEFQKWVDSQDK